MGITAILRHLADGPATNRELQDACCDHSGAIARDMSKLIKAGRARRIDERRGRGHVATYALPVQTGGLS